MGIVRNIIGIVAGVLVAQGVVIACEAIGTALYTVPDDMASFDRAQLAAWMNGVPLPLKLLLLVGWAAGAVAGPWTALRIADRRWTGWAVTVVFFAASVANQMMLPHPAWMMVCALLIPPLGGWAAQRLHHKPYPGEPLLG